jgi:imidazolonepropionase-like amidohydrolase
MRSAGTWRGAARSLAVIAILAAAAPLVACGGGNSGTSSQPPPAPAPEPPAKSGTVAFVGVDVVPMDSEVLLRDQTVVVGEKRIESLGLRTRVAVPEGAQRIDGTGLFLMPGLADMHVHLREADLAAYLANGITTVRNMWGHDAIRAMRERISAGGLNGPTIYSTSPGIDGTPPKWPFTQIVETPAEAEATVARLVGDGWTMLKVYQDLRPDVYAAVVTAAGEHGVRFMGHVPHRIGMREVLWAGQGSLEHLGGYDIVLGGNRGAAGWLNMNEQMIPEVVTWTWEAGAYVCPTLTIVRTMMRGSQSAADATVIEQNRRTLVGALHLAGVPVLLGTDSGIDVVAPGTSIHEELSELHEAGLSPYAAFAAGTIVAAAFLGEQDEFGAVREGLRADLILLDRNPLEDVRAASDPVGVMVNGVWHPRGTLAE